MHYPVLPGFCELHNSKWDNYHIFNYYYPPSLHCTFKSTIHFLWQHQGAAVVNRARNGGLWSLAWHMLHRKSSSPVAVSLPDDGSSSQGALHQLQVEYILTRGKDKSFTNFTCTWGSSPETKVWWNDQSMITFIFIDKKTIDCEGMPGQKDIMAMVVNSRAVNKGCMGTGM